MEGYDGILGDGFGLEIWWIKVRVDIRYKERVFVRQLYLCYRKNYISILEQINIWKKI